MAVYCKSASFALNVMGPGVVWCFFPGAYKIYSSRVLILFSGNLKKKCKFSVPNLFLKSA